ncbi:polynucleotide kinase 3'-phosphatase [Spizellomyces punctatus DAOM BR117]|uniref:Polynucleotide kinase 3'-phosphatase n=1 Tax=Spizellomyces punctatus (strain DAOM BR117) TaxID=645134 RepID=A0A0L0HSH6_SPIPD|nr:polynucleotide kinase 3'-phosphatase [Spizellomyces punctatus DAOM BR117]KND03860.1 polynucleotide kinase 3'-phosphatase [Spizellomyces punctatus DAOM BR117]|eukprot:XP_016611899.1 polynucleotide kinase 3'-phosphatase [Spizellomyces punctatus DAOM BR117]
MANKRKVACVESMTQIDKMELKSDGTEIAAKLEGNESAVKSQISIQDNPPAKRSRSADSLSDVKVATASTSAVASSTMMDGQLHVVVNSTSEATQQPIGTALPIHPFFAKHSTTTAVATNAVLSNLPAVKWTHTSSVLVATYLSQPQTSRIASFDFDGTIVKVRGNHVHAKNADDWTFFHPSVPDRLISLHNQEGYRIVIFSNQKGIEGNDTRSKNRKASFMGRVENVINAVRKKAEKEGVPVPPILVFAATGDDWNRKPRPGMWEKFERDWTAGVVVEKDKSFYVGDAAGRHAGHKPGASKDFADTDHKFALNVGFPFLTPEAFWHSRTTTIPSPDRQDIPRSHHAPHPTFDPRRYLRDDPTTSANVPPTLPPASTQPELILFVGSPASGKSSFARRHLLPHNYVHVNQDTLKSRDRCIKASEAALQQNKSVVIDNTNPDRSTRRLYMNVAQRVGTKLGREIPVRCFWFLADEAVCMHNNVYREVMSRMGRDGHWEEPVRASSTSSKNKPESKPGQGLNGVTVRLPIIAFRNFTARFEPPGEDEGFAEIRKIEFIPEFDSDEERKRWQIFYV